MAKTEFLRTSAESVELWAKRLWIEMPREIYWGKLIGKDGDFNAVIEAKRDLEGGPGDKLTFTLANKLDGEGVSGDEPLEDQEEEMRHHSDDVTLDQRRNAVRLKGRLSEKRTAFDQQGTAKTLLKTWLAEKLDDDVFTKMDDSPTTVVFGAGATSVATLTTTMVITPALIDRCVAKAKKADPKIWPVKIGGEEYYVLLMHTDVGYDLQQNATWNQSTRDAGVRGDENRIFTGRFGMYRGVVLHEHEKVPTAVNGGAAADVPWASNYFMGRQAGCWAWGRRPDAWEKEFDYGNSIGFAIGAIWGFTKAVFNGVDHALISLRVARTNN